MKNTSIGQRIRARRKDLELTQRSLAKALGISHVSVSQWERDDSDPTGKNLIALSDLLQCTPSWILFGDIEPDAPQPIKTELSEQQKELLSLFSALPESEKTRQLDELRARVENFNKLFDELIIARKNAQKK